MVLSALLSFVPQIDILKYHKNHPLEARRVDNPFQYVQEKNTFHRMILAALGDPRTLRFSWLSLPPSSTSTTDAEYDASWKEQAIGTIKEIYKFYEKEAIEKLGQADTYLADCYALRHRSEGESDDC